MTKIMFDPITKSLFLIVILITLYFSKMIVILSLIGLGIGVLISPVLDGIQNKFKIKRGFGAFLFILGMFILAAVILGFFSWVIFDQVNSLISMLPNFNINFQNQIEMLFSKFPWMREQILKIQLAENIQKTFQTILLGTQISFMAIGGGFLSLILGLYIAVDRDFYFNGTLGAFKPQYRQRAQDILIKCAKVVRVWFRAQLIDMAIMGLITTIGLWIVGVKYWAIFGLLTAILGIIPYIGVIIVVVIVGLITLVNDAGQVPWVMLVFFITQQIEGNIVLPMVMKGKAEIPEALLMVVMLFFAFWFGLLGVLIAPPIVAIMICLYRELYLPTLTGLSQNK
jgi:predicted PurR-regulated permease PerM